MPNARAGRRTGKADCSPARLAACGTRDECVQRPRCRALWGVRLQPVRFYRVPKSGSLIPARGLRKRVAFSPVKTPAVSQQRFWIWQTPILPQVSLQLDGPRKLRELGHRGDDARVCSYFLSGLLGLTPGIATAQRSGFCSVVRFHFGTTYHAWAEQDAKRTGRRRLPGSGRN